MNKSGLNFKVDGEGPQAGIWQPDVSPDEYLTHSGSIVELAANGPLVLEELPFERGNDPLADSCLEKLADFLFSPASEYAPFKSGFKQRAVVLDDSDFFHFVKYSTEVEPHNRIDDDKGTVDEKTGVWYTEYLPSESILFSPLFIGKPHIQNNAFPSPAEVGPFIRKLDGQRTWIGGDRTTGKGQVMMHLLKNQEG